MNKLEMENISIQGKKLSARLTGGAMHIVADKLVDCFDSSGAINYLDMAFEHEDTKEIYNLTMSKQSGISKGEIIAQLKADIAKKDRMFEIAWEIVQHYDAEGFDAEFTKYLDEIL